MHHTNFLFLTSTLRYFSLKLLYVSISIKLCALRLSEKQILISPEEQVEDLHWVHTVNCLNILDHGCNIISF